MLYAISSLTHAFEYTPPHSVQLVQKIVKVHSEMFFFFLKAEKKKNYLIGMLGALLSLRWSESDREQAKSTIERGSKRTSTQTNRKVRQ